MRNLRFVALAACVMYPASVAARPRGGGSHCPRGGLSPTVSTSDHWSHHGGWLPDPEHRPPPSGYLFAGAQQLADSDRAFTFDAGVFSGALGFTARFTQFDDRQMQVPGERPLPRNLYSIGWAMRTTVARRLELTGEVGLGGLHRIDEHLFGAMLGGTARIKLERPLALELSGHAYRFDAEASALEGRVGLAAGPVRVSYRVVDFRDARPAVGGPEAAFGFRF